MNKIIKTLTNTYIQSVNIFIQTETNMYDVVCCCYYCLLVCVISTVCASTVRHIIHMWQALDIECAPKNNNNNGNSGLTAAATAVQNYK